MRTSLIIGLAHVEGLIDRHKNQYAEYNHYNADGIGKTVIIVRNRSHHQYRQAHGIAAGTAGGSQRNRFIHSDTGSDGTDNCGTNGIMAQRQINMPDGVPGGSAVQTSRLRQRGGNGYQVVVYNKGYNHRIEKPGKCNRPERVGRNEKPLNIKFREDFTN